MKPNQVQWQSIKDKTLAKIIVQNNCLNALQLQKCLQEIQKNNDAGNFVNLEQWLLIKKLMELESLAKIKQLQQKILFSCPKCHKSYSFAQLNQIQSNYCPYCHIELREPLQNISLQSATVQVFGNYFLLREIARGGMGIVYQAKHKDLGQVVALKVMKSFDTLDAEQQARFKREIKITNKLNHP